MTSQPHRILSLQGGNISALSYLPIIEHLEQHLGVNIAKSGEIHMVLGSSSGTIIAAALKLGLSVQQIKDFFIHDAEQSFIKAKPWNLLFQELLSDGLEGVLEKRFGNITWGEFSAINPGLEVVVMLWNIGKKRICALSTNRPYEEDLDLAKARVVDILVACCAIPYMFPARAFSDGKQEYSYWDGGITGLLNPSILGVYFSSEAKAQGRDIHVISLGAGEEKEEYTAEDISRWTVFDSIVRTIEALVVGPVEMIHVSFLIYGEMLGVSRYLRTNQLRDPNDVPGDAESHQRLERDFYEGKIYAQLISGSDVRDIPSLNSDNLQNIWSEEFQMTAQEGAGIVPGKFVESESNEALESRPVVASWSKRKDLLFSILVGILILYLVLRGVEAFAWKVAAYYLT